MSATSETIVELTQGACDALAREIGEALLPQPLDELIVQSLRDRLMMHLGPAVMDTVQMIGDAYKEMLGGDGP